MDILVVFVKRVFEKSERVLITLVSENLRFELKPVRIKERGEFFL